MKYLVICLIILACSSCNTVDQDEALRETNMEENGLLQTGSDDVNANDNILIESREEVNLDDEHDPLHPTKAEELVKEKLGIQDDENMIVQYDHLEQGNYIIHVYSVDGARENSEAWYMVDLETKDVELIQEK